MKKLRIGVIYGGRSGEHEVSLASAAAVIANLDAQRYDVVPLRIERTGRWVLAESAPVVAVAGEVIAAARARTDRTLDASRSTILLAEPSDQTLMTVARTAAEATPSDAPSMARISGLRLDVVFPVLHGPYGEDGTVQGLLELADVPYVGAGVLASAVGMDKAVQKLVFAARGLPIVAHEVVRRRAWHSDPAAVEADLLARLPMPLFVKPANLGSSVGISKVADASELSAALALAAEHDRKIVIEAGVANAREIECAVLGNDEPQASVPGEIIPSREFYDYEAKYVETGTQTVIPAALDAPQVARVQRLALDAYGAIDCAGMARVDFLLDRDDGALYLNEVNTIPGFTTISMFAKLWEASGLPYARLLDRLIDLAVERHADRAPSSRA